jgi:hypothetical protein
MDASGFSHGFHSNMAIQTRSASQGKPKRPAPIPVNKKTKPPNEPLPIVEESPSIPNDVPAEAEQPNVEESEVANKRTYLQDITDRFLTPEVDRNPFTPVPNVRTRRPKIPSNLAKRAPSPLPPSSLPSTSSHDFEVDENEPPDISLLQPDDEPSTTRTDPFGFLAIERKLKEEREKWQEDNLEPFDSYISDEDLYLDDPTQDKSIVIFPTPLPRGNAGRLGRVAMGITPHRPRHDHILLATPGTSGPYASSTPSKPPRILKSPSIPGSPEQEPVHDGKSLEKVLPKRSKRGVKGKVVEDKEALAKQARKPAVKGKGKAQAMKKGKKEALDEDLELKEVCVLLNLFFKL